MGFRLSAAGVTSEGVGAAAAVGAIMLGPIVEAADTAPALDRREERLRRGIGSLPDSAAVTANGTSAATPSLPLAVGQRKSSTEEVRT